MMVSSEIYATSVALLAICSGGNAFVVPGTVVGRPRTKAKGTSAIASKRWHILNYQQRPDAGVATLNRTSEELAPVDEPSVAKSSPFTPWPRSVVESDGNYAKETYLEHRIGGPLYEHNIKNNLPRLPIPTLEETIEKFIPTALPLCESDEEKKSLLEACRTFADEAGDLQQRLERRRYDWSHSSWLQQWWNQMGYLQVREPVAVHVSYFLNIDDDASLPSQEEMDAVGKEENMFYGANNPGILRGAAAITAAAEVRRRICSGQFPADKAGADPLCSAGFKYMFNSIRIPKLGSDRFKIHDPCLHKHCIVANRGYFFAMDFADDEAHPLPLDTLVHRLHKIEDMAKKMEERGMPKLGYLTGCDRDFWAKSRERLLEVGGADMKNSMEVLESGAFVLCLDEAQPKSQTEANQLFWHGNGKSGGNRWFDKSIQLVCNKDGQIALVGEHSLFDGSSPMVVCKQIKKSTYRRLRRLNPGASPEPFVDTGVHDIFGQCWDDDRDLLATSTELADRGRKKYQELTDSVELKTMVHQDYGKAFIKKGRVSPDAYLQLAMQLAAYRMFGKQLATYEATQTRRFVHGRTETTRTVSLDSQAFVQAMGTESKSEADDLESKYGKLQLLRKAAQTHHGYTVEASNGRGIDRHFFGLSLVLEDDETPPSLFDHPVFARSKSWRLSTSSLPFCPGFGPVVPDGLGIGYSLNNDSCVFNVSSRRENDFVDRYCRELEKALVDMRGLLDCEDTPVE